MRPALPAISLLAVFAVLVTAGAVPPAAEAEWLVMVGGKKIETEGPWTLKGDLLTVHETTGRIVTVATSTVDAAACLKLNGGSLRIEAVAVAPPPGAPLAKPPIAPSAASNAPPSPAVPAVPAPAAAAGSRTGGQAKPPKAAAHPAAAAAPAAPAAPAAASTDSAKAQAERLAAAKQARQAQLQRELRHKLILEGCTRMFVVDRAGFRHCVDVQTQAAPP